MIETYGEDGLVIIAVNEDNDSADAKPFLSDYPPKFQIVWDSAGAIAEQFELIAMPTSYIYDRDGELVTRHLGFKEGRVDEYEQTLRSLLETNERSDSAASH
jgi:hypothetical protein